MAASIEISPNYEKLNRFFGAMEFRQRTKLAKLAMGKTARRIREVAVSAFVGSRIENADRLKQHIRVVPMRRTTGYMVTIMRDKKGAKLPMFRANGRRDFSQQGYIVRFHEGGSYKAGIRRTGKGYSRGILGAQSFMTKAKAQAPAIARQYSASDVIGALTKTAKKYGVIVD